MQYSKSIIEIIKKRKSVRTYDSLRKIEDEKIRIIKEIMLEVRKEGFRFEIVHIKDFKSKKERLGTYGFISGAGTFMVGIVDNTMRDKKLNTIEFGQTFEKIILKATDLGLGTCWMVSTYNKHHLALKICLEDNESFAIVSPLGYPALKKRTVEKLMRVIPKSDQRKPWKKLFFSKDLSTELTKTEAGDYSLALDMLRLAPSAANTQPWRILKQNDGFDLFIVKDNRWGRRTIDCNYNDAGIAMCHFELTARELGLPGKWIIDNARNDNKTNQLEYINTWKMTNNLL
ncbi:MAG: nitroreductase [Candidatus Heimdallarchaeota archaeon]|nr:nitroreductase [Candidatus Heimdallarchaeota archaeon]